MVQRWYVVQTKPGLEQFASDELRKQKFKVFYPAYLKQIKRAGKFVTEVRPLYPSYIFIKFDIKKARWSAIKNTRGVQCLIGGATENYVTALPIGLVEGMIAALDGKGFVNIQNAAEELINFTPGMQLVIRDTRYNGLVGVCIESTPKRVSMLLSLLNRKIKVELDIAAVKPLEPV